MRRVLLLIGLLLIAGGFYWAVRFFHRTEIVLPPPTTRPTTTVAVAPSTAPALPKPVNYMGVVLHNFPEFPTTQPLMVPVAMNEAARLIIPDPIYLDTQGELWITRADAEPTSSMFKAVHEQSTHVLKEQVVFVHRWPDDTQVWQPQLICKKTDGGYEIVTRGMRREIPGDRRYQFYRAFSWNDAIVVPTDRGISVIRPDSLPMEIHHEFVTADQYDAAKHARVEALLDWRGLIAWMPWDEGKVGSKGVARFVEKEWAALDSSNQWPEKVLHLVPLLDGSVLLLVLNEDGTAEVRLRAQDLAEVDVKAIEGLVDQLSDSAATKRDEAFGKLTRYGVGSWPVLERLLPNQPPEARFRIEQLLSAKAQPHLGGMILQPGPVKVIARGDIGAALVYAEKGVAIPRTDGLDPYMVAPAWLSIVPGQSITLAPQGFADELKQAGKRLSIVRGEWLVSDDTVGPRWWLSNHFSPNLLKPDEVQFGDLIGLDGRGRWLFRKSAQDLSPTLIVDPTLPNPKPRLPIWVYVIEDGQVGWTKENWPAIKLGGTWALINADWTPMDDDKEKIITLMPDPPSAPAFARALGTPILIEKDGTRFYGGQHDLKMVQPDGRRVIWRLPDEAMGLGRVELFRAGDNRLFLLNSRGRISLVRQMPHGPEPFKLEAVFTKKVPNIDRPSRVWIDPAGRLVFAYSGNSLAIAFPDGRIPPDIAKKMTAKDLEQAEE